MEEYQDGTFVVLLGAITDLALVATAVTQALGLTESGDRPPEEFLKGYLRDGQMLLSLDNLKSRSSRGRSRRWSVCSRRRPA